jgi:scyllo-inositol 2-dehydrogenase (NADP+)
MTMHSPLRAGLVGFGLAGRVFHAPFLDAHPDIALDQVVTSSAARAREVGYAYPQARVVDSVRSLDAHRLDVLVLGGPPHTHHAHARWALERGIAVVVDKPFMASVAQASDVLELAEARGGRVTVFHNRRWDGDFVGLRTLVDDPALGEVFELETSFEHWDPRPGPGWKRDLPVSRGGGVTMDLGSHLIDQAILLLGPVVDVVSDLRGIRPGAGNDDVARLRLRHLSGAMTTVRMSRLADQPAPRFRVSATNGSIVVHGLDPQEPLLESGVAVNDLRRVQQGETRTASVSIDGQRSEVELPPGEYSAFTDLLVAWLREDAPAPVDPYEALEVVRVLERATAALR